MFRAYLLALWDMVRYRIRRWTMPDRAYNVRIAGNTAVFMYAGNLYRGHHFGDRPLAPYPWYSSTRRSLKRPTAAIDAKGKDVTARVLQYWGPLGGWNESVGLSFVPELDKHISVPVTVSFNDSTITEI